MIQNKNFLKVEIEILKLKLKLKTNIGLYMAMSFGPDRFILKQQRAFVQFLKINTDLFKCGFDRR